MSRHKKIAGLILILMITAGSRAVRAQEPYVYLVNADNQLALTGFRARGTGGIITALHGVAGARTITARSVKGPILREPLAVVEVDVRRDLALLSSPELQRMGDGGFEVANEVDWPALGRARVRVVGYPVGIDLEDISRSLEVGRPPLKRLELLLEPEGRLKLRERMSPDPTIEVVNLQGPVLPGHSGAPVLDPRNRVVAVANGGLKGGTVGIAWAIPYRDVRWERAESSGALAALRRQDSRILFSFEDNPRAISDKIDEIRGSLGELIKEERKTQRLIEPVTETERLQEFEVLRHSYLLGHCLTLAVAVRTGGQGPNPAKDEFSARLLAKARSHASYLGLTTPIELPALRGDERLQDYLPRFYPLCQSLNEGIRRTHGVAPRSAFELACQAGIWGPYLDDLADVNKKDVVDGFRRDLRIIRVPEAALEKFLRDIAPKDQSARVGAIFGFKDSVLDSLHGRVANTVWRRKRELDTWIYASKASLFVAAYSTGKVGPNDFPDLLAKARGAGERLGLAVPGLPERTGDRIKDAVVCLHYILADLGNDNADDIRERFGADAVAILELAVKLNALLIIYGPGDRTSEAALSAITRTCRAMKAPEDIWMPLVRQIQRGEDYEVVKRGISAFDEHFKEHLEWRVEASEPNPPVPGRTQ